MAHMVLGFRRFRVQSCIGVQGHCPDTRESNGKKMEHFVQAAFTWGPLGIMSRCRVSVV